MEKLKLSDDEETDFLKFGEILDADNWVISNKIYSECDYIMKEMRLNSKDFDYIYFVLEHKESGDQYITRNEKVI